MNYYPDMLMKQQRVSQQERELPRPAPKIKSLKSKQLPSLGCGRGGANKKMLKMMVGPDISMKTKDGESLLQVDPAISMKTSWLQA
jgi:hypothetical protein